jgi:hypothetical protein
VDRCIDAERVGGLQLFGPVDVAERAIERLGRLDPKPAERLEHADRRPRFEHGAIERLLLSARQGGKLDRPPADPQIDGPDGLELPREQPLEAFERAGREPRRLVETRRGQRPRRRGDGGEGHG